MKRFLVVCLMLTAFVMLASGCSKGTSVQKKATVAENKPAPDIAVSSLQNVPLRLSDLKGKVVLLNFWATWCPPCREEIPSMIKLNNFMAGKPFQMVAVSIDEGGQSSVELFLKESGFGLPAYIDPENKASKTYGITGVPETFIIDKNGILKKKVVGPLAWDSPEVIGFLEGLMK